MLNCIDLSLFNESRSCCSFFLQLRLFFVLSIFLPGCSSQVLRHKFLSQIKHIRIIEWHMVSVTTKNDQVVLVHDTSMTISGRWLLSFDAAIGLILLEHAIGALEAISLLLDSLSLLHLVVV